MKLLLLLLTVLVIFLISINPLAAAAKVVLLIAQEFPQIPFRPLHNITQDPIVEKVQFSPSPDGAKAVGDLFIPKNVNIKPAIIVAMGLKTSDKDRPILLGFCETLARLGYVVLWPRSVDLENDVIKLEEPQTFIDSFNFLKERDDVDKNRISYVGFSVGSSLALVAAEDEKINEYVRSVVFFGGYYSILDYLSSLSTNTIVLDKQTTRWQAAKSAVDHAQRTLEKEGLLLNMFDKKNLLDPELAGRLSRFSPDQNIDSVNAKIFILHEKSDTFVPYTESIKLKQALEEKGKSYDYHLANLFKHVQPKEGISVEMINEFSGLFVFLHKVFMRL